MRTHAPRIALTLSLAGSLSACTVGPNYVRPTAAAPAVFKEAQVASNSPWRQAQPSDTIDRGAWWSMFNDPVLDGLEKRVEISNQNIAAAAAAYDQARALVDQSRASLFPTVGASATATRSSGGRGGQVVGGFVTSGTGAQNRFAGTLTGSWDADLWGRIKRTVEANSATAQASAADLANARLSAQSQLAIAYFGLRVTDELKGLLTDTVAAYQRAVDLAQNRYDAGVIARADVISAQTQLQSAQAQLTDLDVGRAQNEHAIALLIGAAPADLTIPRAKLAQVVPPAPVIVPSDLLERRPDIASDERQVAAANAQIGVATAAYFPSLTLSGSVGTSSSVLGDLFSAGTNTWSIGPALAETLLDFGARKARVRQARALHAQRTAEYRQTVLGAFQQVEDQLAALRVYADEAKFRELNAASARQAEALALNRYKAGQVDFTTVITAQAQSLTAQQNLLTLVRQRLQASVSLVQALGGGWTTAELPKI
ncbi:MAG: efflux transporter outer membrane subunit [Caulobacteraceae bacterium]